VSPGRSLNCPLCAESPFAFPRCYLFQEQLKVVLNERYLIFIATTNSCAIPLISDYPCRYALIISLCRLLQAPADKSYFPTLSLQIFHWMLNPLLRCFLECIFSFLPPRRRPSRTLHTVGISLRSTQQLQCGPCFRSCRYFLLFRPPVLLATLVAHTYVLPHGIR